MIERLKRKYSKSKNVDTVSDYIDDTIDKELGDDVLLELNPILSKYDLAYNDKYFKINKISPNANVSFTSQELKTMAYLGSFYKERVKYNIGEIERYLSFLGYDVEHRATDIQCFKIADGYSVPASSNIDYQVYLGLFDGNARPYLHTINSNISTVTVRHNVNNDIVSVHDNGDYDFIGFEDGHDISSMR